MKAHKSKMTAIITGGSSGIGLATACRFASAGFKTYILDIQPIPQSIEDPLISYVKCDVSQFENVDNAIKQILKNEKKFDAIFANAGIHFYGSIEETDPQDLDKILAVNLKGVFFILKCVLPIMKKQKSGAIILMGSDQSIIGKPFSAAYGVTKGAIVQLAKSTAIDYGPFNIRVNCICPGAVKTPLYDRAVEQYSKKYAKTSPEDLTEQLTKRFPLGRIGQPDEIADLVFYLCSQEASFITGAVISIDGGFCAQ